MASVHYVAYTALSTALQIGITMPAFALYKNMITTVPGFVETCAIP
jgi:hypothetical protein